MVKTTSTEELSSQELAEFRESELVPRTNKYSVSRTKLQKKQVFTGELPAIPTLFGQPLLTILSYVCCVAVFDLVDRDGGGTVTKEELGELVGMVWEGKV